ncbi:MAG: hypothetical protein DRR16_31715 [Candidatus Parabeggiatoa sp. nov. 3]|nr:MAG: hypothetical protein DRR00_13400 [Gammaproteobacteria bacterium]RKZ62391.1 MAG: hypothetical protein DRQ99_18795 [Gammaproteobacteria bacterium]RKZ74957.1 MAG: hypothetical protein DRR16_31715 [Gammaproteobacteria bacterium]
MAPHAPAQNPVEDIWLNGKTFLRRHFFENKTFAYVAESFFNFLKVDKSLTFQNYHYLVLDFHKSNRITIYNKGFKPGGLCSNPFLYQILVVVII